MGEHIFRYGEKLPSAGANIKTTHADKYLKLGQVQTCWIKSGVNTSPCFIEFLKSVKIFGLTDVLSYFPFSKGRGRR